MEERIISIIREKLSSLYHEYLSDKDNSDIYSRLTTVLEIANSVKSLEFVYENPKYEDFSNYIEKVEQELYK